VNPPRRAKREISMGYVERGHLIRELLRLLQTLDVKKAMTVKELSDESGMELRQVYR
jgi:hypothetical protein